jgi:microcin C transport system substrate-binding protein
MVTMLLTTLLATMLCSCNPATEGIAAKADFESWYPRYNRYIAKWLAGQSTELENEITELETRLTTTTEASTVEKLEESLAELHRTLARVRTRQQRGDYFQFHAASDLPAGLAWEDGMEQPEIGDPAATKGGTFRFWLSTFPPTIRPFGPNSNNSFRGELYDNIELGLVDLHPETGELIPGCAKQWAIGPDQRTVFFRLDPDAAYNDGVKVEPIDFMWFIYLRASDNVLTPWFKQYLREQIAGLAIYGDDIIAVTLPDPRPKLAWSASLPPCPRHFYADYGPDYAERYQWRVPPTTAPYTILAGDIVKGVSITLTRDKDWWARDRKYYRHRFNVDHIRYTVVRDLAKAWELFRAGEIDYFPLTLPEYWYEKSEMDPVFDGYIERFTYYNQFPRIPWALYLNIAKPPLDNHDVRLGIAHATNWQKVIDVVFRGDAARLPGWTRGFGPVDNPAIQARPFSITQAREHFARAGFTEEGSDGILRNARGERLEAVISYTKVPVRDTMMGILKEEARKAGLDFVLDAGDGTAGYKKQMEKEHEIAFSAWGFQPPYPRYYEYFHSSNARDEKGNLKQNTNNVFSYADDRMDKLATRYRFATDEAELIRTAHEMQQIIHDEAIFIPGYMTEFQRLGTWRWIRWPDSEFTEFSPPMKYSPFESYAFWIDKERKAETLEARRTGRTFPEVEAIKDRYRTR